MERPKHNTYAAIGLKALRRAAAKVAEDARRNKYKIPIWRNGHIAYEIPEPIVEQGGSIVGGADNNLKNSCNQFDDQTAPEK